MKLRRDDDVQLNFDDSGYGSPVLFIHGWGCNREIFQAQIDVLSTIYRVVAIDLRGHGDSDAPHQKYTMGMFADDVAWLCMQLDLHKPVIVGHGMGGIIALELAARYPNIPHGIVLIDSVLFPDQSEGAIAASDSDPLYRSAPWIVVSDTIAKVALAIEHGKRYNSIVDAMEKTPHHVLMSTLENHTSNYDPTDAAARCKLPIAYVGSANSSCKIKTLKEKCPQLMLGQVEGTGYFSILEKPRDVCVLLMKFIYAFTLQ